MVNVSGGLWWIAVACVVLASCKDKDTNRGAAGGGEPATPEMPEVPSTDAAGTAQILTPYLMQDDQLVRLVDGKSEVVLEHSGTRYCEADSRAQAIWLLSSAGLSVYDLVTKKLEIVVASESGPIEAFEVRFGLDQGKVGNADGSRHDIALIVVAAVRNTIRSEIVCEGEREKECYVESDSDDPDLWELQPEAALLKSLYDELTLSNTALLTSVAARRSSMVLNEDLLQTLPTPEHPVEGRLLCGIMAPPTTLMPIPSLNPHRR